ncbi:MAG: arylsulfatase A-like enzyme [Planctomycetota bacterium]|jgi:arylsulfatase A-like enzyme
MNRPPYGWLLRCSSAASPDPDALLDSTEHPLTAGLCLAALTLCLPACSDEPEPTRPNVLLISIDSLRADHLGCYGYERDTSPAIDRLAREGALFRQVSSSTSWTLPAHASLFTALPDSVHLCDRNSRVLAPSRTTLAEAMGSEGYATAGLWSGPYLHPRFGLAQGFDHYRSCASFEIYSDDNLRSHSTPGPGAAPAGQFRANRLSHEDITSPRILEEVEAFLGQEREDPFFLFVHMWDVHYDFIPPEPYASKFDSDYAGPVDGGNLSGDWKLGDEGTSERDREHLLALYDAEIAWTDHHVGKILERLDTLGLADDTIVVLTADHGEEFFEHGLFGHRKTLYEEVLNIPLIIRYPGTVEAGKSLDRISSIIDIAPTILDLAGARKLRNVLGQSLVPEMEGSAVDSDSVAIAELFKPRSATQVVSLRSERWKLLYERTNGESIGLWDMLGDPAEASNVLEVNADLREEAEEAAALLQVQLDELEKQHSSAGSEAASGLPPELEKNLRELGYLGGSDEDE